MTDTKIPGQVQGHQEILSRLARKEHPIQEQIPFAPPATAPPLAVLDLFAGIGGMSMGFRDNGFEVTGVDSDEVSAAVFSLNSVGQHLLRDLRTQSVASDAPVVIGGPPCRPWSSVNQQKRGRLHEDHALLERFFEHLIELRPRLFVMENVPPLMNDPDYLRLRREMEFRGYSIAARVLRYSEFGAASKRRRLFTVGIKDFRWSGTQFFTLLEEERQNLVQESGGPATVREAIWWLREMPCGAVPDHEWSQLHTIDRYEDRYASGRFGWKQLGWDEPAPSFGSVAKTYILHPDRQPHRVISVREVLSILGFPREFQFPPDTALHRRYRMAANAVSPIFSRACAGAVKRILQDTAAAGCS